MKRFQVYYRVIQRSIETLIVQK